MNIEFVNHASFIADHNNIRLICDPWTEGTAFHNGWSLMSNTRFRFEDYKTITHIWFSHEHPDHFSPPNISKIDPEIRKNITVLYQETNDKKVVEWCRKKGFKEVIELKKNTYFRLGDDFEVMNAKHKYDDSWLLIKTKDKSILNVNDCVISNEEEAREIRSAWDFKVDILFTQFSYASYHGNRDEPAARVLAAAEKLDEIDLQIKVFQPEFVVPFASYVWFSHEENYYMNDGINKVDKVYDHLKSKGVTPVVLYPGDIWNTDGPHNSAASVAQFIDDYKTVFADPKLTKTIPVSLDEIKANGKEMSKKAVNKYGKLYFRTRLRNLKPLVVHITDMNNTVSFDFLHGIKPATANQPDISMSSEALNFCLKNDFGFNTIAVNARFQVASEQGFEKYRAYDEITSNINHNHDFVAPDYFSLAVKKVLRMTGIRK